MTIGILASGGLGKTVLEHLLHQTMLAFAATDSKSEGIVQLAHKSDVPLFLGNPRNGKLLSFLRENSIHCDLLLSVNYLFLIEKDLIDSIPKIVNFHGSLLPKYRGRTPHVWAIINNEKKTGITAHLIDEGCDTGDVVLQNEVIIEAEDTGADILKKYQSIYPLMIDEILDRADNNKLSFVPQNDSLATYFGKRTPEDGGINWDWHKERIYNWVRAQADPYPGAFCFSGNQKVIIDKISFSELGYKQEVPNGLVLETSPKPIVKCPNGAIVLETIRDSSVTIEKSTILK